MLSVSRSGQLDAGPLRVIGWSELDKAFDKAAVLAAVRQALIDHAESKTFSPPPMHLLFPAPGDCHIKAGGRVAGSRFIVKVACGFYDNPQRGLSTNSGLQILMNASTGRPLAILDDEGLLTSWRTAGAAVEAATIVKMPKACTAGIIGCGEQGELIGTWLPDRLPVDQILLWNRTGARAEALAAHLRTIHPHLSVQVAPTIADVVAHADVVFTATPAQSPLLNAGMVRGPLHVIALGADTPGKNEIAADLLANTAWIATDDHDQCLNHGEFGNAVRAGVRDANSDLSVGALLAAAPRDFSSVSVVDLTGIAAQDLAISSLFYDRHVQS